MKSKIGIIGSGNVGSALQKGISKAGYEVRISNEENVAEVAGGADIVILAVPFTAVDDVIKKLGNTVKGKILIDATNALTPDFQLAVGFTTSGAEELQKKAPQAKVVKAFNTVFAQNMESGKLNGKTLTAFAAGDDESAKKQVLELEKAIGFDAVDAGPLANSRQLEALGYFNIQLGYFLKNGTETGFIYAH
ncbi:MAG: NADPH-dependent F420 reductase [Bacteriovoracaceae bacterium]|nr:NADPH-dependent F420 reductase [Bacteriovoracaceae bacterium]